MGKRSSSFFTFSLRYYKDIVNLLFCKVILLTSTKRSSSFAGKKSTPPAMFFWRYCKNIQTYLGYFWHASLHTPKMIVSTCIRI